MGGNRGIRAVAGALLALSVGVNLFQAQKIRAMTRVVDRPGRLVGTVAQPIVARTPAGRESRLTFGSGLPTVLYYFSASCGWCERNWTNVEALAANAEGRYRVVAVTSTEGIKAYVDEHRLKVEVLEGLPAETIEAYRLISTPHTVVIDGSGVVTHEWSGAYTTSVARRVEDLFGMVLPGLTPVPKKTN